MGNLSWPDYVAATGAAFVLFSFIFVTIQMWEHEDKQWALFADTIPFLSHVWFAVRHWRRIRGTLIVGLTGTGLLTIGLYYN